MLVPRVRGQSSILLLLSLPTVLQLPLPTSAGSHGALVGRAVAL